MSNIDNEKALKAIEHLIGATYVSTLKEYISSLTGFDPVRGPDEPVHSLEFRPGRVTIHADEAGKITKFTAG